MSSAEVTKNVVQNLICCVPKVGGGPQIFEGHLQIDTTYDLLAKFD